MILEFIVGWEALMYTAPEEDGAVDVCLAVRTEVEIHTPARFELTTSPSEAQGNYNATRKSLMTCISKKSSCLAEFI